MIEKLLNDKVFLSIKHKFFKMFPKLDKDDIDSAYAVSLWKAVEKYSPDKLTKFTTFFYSIFLKQCLTLSKIKRIKTTKLKDKIVKFNTFLIDLLTDITEYEHKLIVGKYLEQKTLQELGDENECSAECIRKTIDNCLKKIKED